jgi:hypothetical protein
MQAGDMYNQRYSAHADQRPERGQDAGGVDVRRAFCADMRAATVINGTMYVHTLFLQQSFAIDLDAEDQVALRAQAGRSGHSQMCHDTVYRVCRMPRTRSSCSKPTACWSHWMPAPARSVVG